MNKAGVRRAGIILVFLGVTLWGLGGLGCDCDRDWSVSSSVQSFVDSCGNDQTKFSYTVTWERWNSPNGRPTQLEVFVDQNICSYIVDHSSEYHSCQADRVVFTFSDFQFGESKTVWFTLDGDWSDKSGTARLTVVYQGHTCDYQVRVPKRLSHLSCDCEDYDVDFVSAVYDANTNRTAFTYQATSSGDPGLSHFILEIPVNGCVRDRWISGGEWVNPDPTTGVSGLKFDGGAGTYTFYLEGDWSSSSYRAQGEVTTKAGAGCVCECITTLLPTGCPPVNDPPVAEDDAATTDEDTPVTIAVLTNDSDPDGDPLTVTGASDPAHGTAQVNPDGTITYTPAAGFHGTDFFTYTVEDNEGAVSNVATVTITVIPIYELTITVAGTGSGTTDPSPGVHYYHPGAVVSLSATPAPGSRFDGWTGPDAGDIVDDEIVMDGDKDLVANFSLIPVSLKVDKIGNAVEAAVGDTIEYTILVTNTGEAPLERVRVVDELLGLERIVPVLAPDETVTFRGTYVPTVEDLPAVTNEAVAEATYFDRQVRARDTWRVEVSYTSAIELSKAALDMQGQLIAGAAVDDVVIYRFEVTNVGDVPLSQITLTDSVLGDIVGPNDGDLDLDNVLDPGETWGYEVYYRISEEDFNRGYVENVGVVRGVDPFGEEVAATVTHRLEVAVGGAAAAPGCEGRVIISEVAWSGTWADPEHEWIELHNLDPSPVDLSGWVLRWRYKHPTTPEQARWRIVRLSGEISGCQSSPCTMQRLPEPVEHEVVRHQEGDLVWWELRAQPVPSAPQPGYFLLERGHDQVVTDVDADLIYDRDFRLGLELPDEGAIIQLLDPRGVIVDTANVDPEAPPGWVAGDLVSRASMERIDPLGPDRWGNWRTNVGLVVHGRDSSEIELLATVATTNLGLAAWAELGVGSGPNRLTNPVEIRLPLLEGAREQGWPRMILERKAEGGWLPRPLPKGITVKRTDPFLLGLDPAHIPAGEYRLWVVCCPGHLALIWFQTGD